MRILYFDIDSLRTDHLGCYGYPRPTSPVIDGIAARGRRWRNCFASDVPCLPSRTALFSGRPGIVTGCVNHVRDRAVPYFNRERGFSDCWDRETWMSVLRRQGFRTASISSFPERHSAWHWCPGFNDILNCGGIGHETVDEVLPLAEQWLRSHGRDEDWFLHVNFWDVHVPYRSPDQGLGELSLPDWSLAALARDRDNPGRRAPERSLPVRKSGDPLATPDDLKNLFQGCDDAVRSVDTAIGQVLAWTEELGVREDLVIIIAADHGENMGEWSSYAGHSTADACTSRIPLIIQAPGRFDDGAEHAGLCQHMDLAASIVALAGGEQPASWRAEPLPEDDHGRSFVVSSQLAQCVQRAVHWLHDGRLWGYLRTAVDFGHGYPPECVYRPDDAPPAPVEEPALLEHGRQLLDAWIAAEQGPQGDPWDAVLADPQAVQRG